MPVILVTWEAEIKRVTVQVVANLGDPISKITRAKWTRGVVQAVECLSSNPSSTKRNLSVASHDQGPKFNPQH
jgi:hypothetical protein